MMNKTRIKDSIALLAALVIMVGTISIVVATDHLVKEEKAETKAQAATTYKVTPDEKRIQLDEARNGGMTVCLSSDRGIADVRFDGSVRIGKIGTADITILDRDRSDGISAPTRVRVKVANEQNVTTEKAEYAVTFGDDPALINAVSDAETPSRLTYESSDEDIVTVDKDGKLTFHNAGQATVTVKAEETPYYFEARKDIPVTVGKKDQQIEVAGQKYTVSIVDTSSKVKVKTDTDHDVTFKVENPEIAKITKKGVIKPLAVGKTKVTISQKGTKNYNASEETVALVVREPNTQERIQGAIQWALDIAADDSFVYGTKPTTNRVGCYFCGTNQRNKPRGYEKTYVCMTFVCAAYAHGAQDPEMLAIDQEGRHTISTTDSNYQKYRCWRRIGSCGSLSINDLEPGDVLVKYDSTNGSKGGHVCMYIGNDQLVEASGGGWDPGSISVKNDASGRLRYYSGSSKNYVMRYVGPDQQ